MESGFAIDANGEKVLDPIKVREYEKNRLKYYYAVITFDNKFTCEKVYDNFDGLEIEFSGCQLDLRILPKDLKIEKEPEEQCYEVQEKDRKKIPKFLSKALGHTDVELTWD